MGVANSCIQIGIMELHAPSNPKLLSPEAKALSFPLNGVGSASKKLKCLQTAIWLISSLRGR